MAGAQVNIELRDALRRGSLADARQIVDGIHPADVADLYEHLNAIERTTLVSLYPDDELADLLEYLPIADAHDIFTGQSSTLQTEIIDELPDDFVVDLLQEADDWNQIKYLGLLSEKKQAVAQALLKYPDDSAGGRMTTAFASVRESMTIREVIEDLSDLREETEVLSRIYVVDDEDRLIGKVRLRDLTFNKRSGFIADIMDNETLAVLARADQEDAVMMMTKYDLLAVPVTDASGKLLGVITYDDAFEIQEEETTEDLERQAAIAGSPAEEPYLSTSVFTHLKRRFPWVLGLAILAILSGVVILHFEEMLTNTKGAFLIMIYMPMIVAAGGNTGAQAATMVIRAMSLGEFTPSSMARVCWKEIRVGLLLGSLVGLGVALVTPLVKKALAMAGNEVALPNNLSDAHMGLTVALALTCQITTSTLLGAALPIIARSLKLDPAIVASPAITTIVDVTGLIIYFSLAKVVLGI